MVLPLATRTDENYRFVSRLVIARLARVVFALQPEQVTQVNERILL
jgi:hypothetical protein